MSDRGKRPALVAIAEVKAEYGVDRSTVFRWIAEKRLRAVKRQGDKRTYVRRSALEAELAKERQGRGSRGNWRPAPLLEGQGQNEEAPT